MDEAGLEETVGQGRAFRAEAAGDLAQQGQPTMVVGTISHAGHEVDVVAEATAAALD